MIVKSPLQETRRVFDTDKSTLFTTQMAYENSDFLSNLKDIESLGALTKELESKYIELKNIKILQEKVARSKEETNQKFIDQLKAELLTIRRGIDEKQLQMLIIISQIKSYKNLIAEKENEIHNLNNDMDSISIENNELNKSIINLSSELSKEKSEKLEIQQKEEIARILSNSLLMEKRGIEEKIKKYELDLGHTNRRIIQASDENNLLSAENMKIEEDLKIIKESKSSLQNVIEKRIIENTNLLEDKRVLEEKSRELEIHMQDLEKQISDTCTMISMKEREISNAKINLNFTESNTSVAVIQLKQLIKEKDTFEILMNQYKKEAEANKKLKDENAARASELQSEKIKLESIFSSKEMESLKVKKELDNIGQSHIKLREENVYLSKEIDALREHASILEKQNLGLTSEIDKILMTDSKVREDLDRKAKHDYLKLKNLQELQKSTEKVLLAKSPKKF